ncbi:hypothetical protein [Psychrobacillus lasiicapitis]|uniref:hypothetical protein n=1 Tax=Psychrobacillus lasiicapitis TaxID=1636719 RepID=UPI001B8786AF|nr:hypothetical protein [Psychrobacillus lasiicapitis]
MIGIIPIIGEPFSLPFLIAAIVPIAIIQIWAIIYLIDPYKNEKSYYLFFGIYGVVNTYVYFLVIQKLLYVNMGATGLWPFITGILLFILLIVGMNWMNWKSLYSGTYHRLQQKRTIPVSWIAIGGASYVLGQIVLSFIHTDSTLSIFLIVCISFLSLLTAFFSIYIHRYFFICKNLDIVKKLYPEFGLPKSERYKRKNKINRKKEGKR